MTHRRKSIGRFSALPHSVQGSKEYARLKAQEVKLLMDLLFQYNGKNNGMLSPCYSLLKKQGWARSNLYRAYAGLEHSGFIVVTRRGLKIRGMASLIAITWNEINEPKGKIVYDDRVTPSTFPLNYWNKPKDKWKLKPILKKP